MSECPNCEAAGWVALEHHVAETAELEALIRSLREELAETNNILRSECREVEMLQGQLAEAREVIKGLEPLAKYYVEHKERCYDQMRKGKQGRTFARDSAIWARQQYNQALRNNEHRSDT